MRGQVISFQARLQGHRRPAPSRDIAGTRSLERQVARIAYLLEELQDLTRSTMELTPAVMARAQATMQQARAVMGSLEGGSGGDGEAGDPQPEVDRELVARFYRELYPDR